MTLMTTTIEELVEKLTPEVVQGYQNAEDKPKYVGKFCQDNYHSDSKGFRTLMDCLMQNTEKALAVHGLIVPVTEE